MVRYLKTLAIFNFKQIRTLDLPEKDDGLFFLVQEVLAEPNRSVLVFCGTKHETQETAKFIAQVSTLSDWAELTQKMPPSVKEVMKDKKNLLLQKLQLANSGLPIDKDLMVMNFLQCILNSTANHSLWSGLP